MEKLINCDIIDSCCFLCLLIKLLPNYPPSTPDLPRHRSKGGIVVWSNRSLLGLIYCCFFLKFSTFLLSPTGHSALTSVLFCYDSAGREVKAQEASHATSPSQRRVIVSYLNLHYFNFPSAYRFVWIHCKSRATEVDVQLRVQHHNITTRTSRSNFLFIDCMGIMHRRHETPLPTPTSDMGVDPDRFVMDWMSLGHVIID